MVSIIVQALQQSPVKSFDSRENSSFTLLYCPMSLVQTKKSSASPRISDFHNSGKSPWHPFSSVGSKFKYLRLLYWWKGNLIRINIVLRTRVKKSTYFELLIENGKYIWFCGKNCQDMKKWLNKITTIV